MKSLLLCLLSLVIVNSYAQYCNTATTNDAITPTTTVQYSTTYNSGRRAFNFNAVAGNEYTFSTVGETTVDTYLRLYSTGTGGTSLVESDDYYNTQSEITWYCTATGTYSVLLTRWTSTSSCSNLNANARIKYQMGSSAGSTIVTIGSGEGVVYVVPAYHYYKYNWSQMIYLKSEINTAGNITKIRFQVDPSTSPASYTATNQKIYMAHTTLSTFPSVAVKENAQTNYASSNYTLVYDGTIVWTIGWVEITLQTPFPWNNTDNLLIKYENRHGSWTSSYPGFYYTSKTATVGYQYQDASYPTSDGTRDGFRPNIKLAISDPTPLPVTLHSFEGTERGSVNQLYWTTTSEHNSNYFNVQKSLDGDTWETFATVNAAEYSDTPIEYSVIDFHVAPTLNYYRLQQYDYDGAYDTYGPIIINNEFINKKTVVKYMNTYGQEISYETAVCQGVYFEVYDDGTAKKIVR